MSNNKHWPFSRKYAAGLQRQQHNLNDKKTCILFMFIICVDKHCLFSWVNCHYTVILFYILLFNSGSQSHFIISLDLLRSGLVWGCWWKAFGFLNWNHCLMTTLLKIYIWQDFFFHISFSSFPLLQPQYTLAKCLSGPQFFGETCSLNKKKDYINQHEVCCPPS